MQSVESVSASNPALPGSTGVAAPAGGPPSHAPRPTTGDYDNQLVQVRLGIASGLFMSLKGKHAATAAHSLRVALGASAWTIAMDLPGKQLDEIEVAGLLHDIGKIGVPDNVLLKPGKVTPSEAALMDRHRRVGLDILHTCCASPPILEIVRYTPAWYDGSRTCFDRRGDDLPIGSRMLAIVDAFDSMTSDHVYRRGMSRERALGELYQFAGTQFDPALVKQFSRLHDGELLHYHKKVARRWLEELDRNDANTYWELNTSIATTTEAVTESLFHQKLLDNMRDGVVFIDSNLQIQLWNRGSERLTGIPSSSVYQRSWIPSLIGLCDEKGKLIADEDCPIKFVLRSGVQSIRRLLISSRRGRKVSVDVHIVPVIGQDGTTHGANLLLHDASPEASLEERCQSLHEKATRDPLTQVANRAEFDRAHILFVKTHLERGLPCSLIMCDIDHFKRVNDTFGHQAGDECIKVFAQLLKQMCRPGDLVARYGGEEFVVLCADCDNATAAARAEQIRRALADLPLSMVGGQHISATFGVTEVQRGDSAETMLRRSDRALLAGKDSGRNTVVQMGTGIDSESAPKKRSWFPWRKRSLPDILLESDLITPVPLKVAVEKLRGFAADHNATVESVDGANVQLRIDGSRVGLLRRTTDRPVAFQMELAFGEEQVRSDHLETQRKCETIRTRVHVVIRPKRDRDRRRADAVKRARHVLSSLRSYLMAVEADPDDESDVLERSPNFAGSWLEGA